MVFIVIVTINSKPIHEEGPVTCVRVDSTPSLNFGCHPKHTQKELHAF